MNRWFTRGAAFACLMLMADAATAQTIPADFTALPADNPTIHVIDSAGHETKGRLLRFDPESLTIAVRGREVRFERERVNWIYRRGDSLKNGMLTGLAIGASIGAVTGLTFNSCGPLLSSRPCRPAEKLAIAGVLSGVFGGIGLGIGTGVDALIRGRRPVYARPASNTSFAIVPESRRGASAIVSVQW